MCFCFHHISLMGFWRGLGAMLYGFFWYVLLLFLIWRGCLRLHNIFKNFLLHEFPSPLLNSPSKTKVLIFLLIQFYSLATSHKMAFKESTTTLLVCYGCSYCLPYAKRAEWKFHFSHWMVLALRFKGGQDKHTNVTHSHCHHRNQGKKEENFKSQ